jgi:TetR/AcrR family transcriptional repressor of nem operon
MKGELVTKGEQTRQRIVAAAAPIFNQHGYAGSSIVELMKATGLTKGGIYRHFSCKEELAAEAFDYTWETARDARLVDVDEKTVGVDLLKLFIANFIDKKPPVPGGCPILNTAIDADDGNPVLRERARKALRAWSNRLQDILKVAAEHGQLQPGVAPKTVATLIIATLEGALMISRLERNYEPLRRVQEHLNYYLDTQVRAVR